MKQLLAIIALGMTTGLTAQITVDNYTIELEADVDQLETVAPITAQSDCGEVTVTLKEAIYSGGCLGNLVRSYVFTDECGNSTTAEQFIKLTDSTPPVIDEVPPTLSAGIDHLPEAPAVNASDNSGKPVSVSLSEKRVDDNIVRIWTAEDQCGNTSIMKQTIKLTDI